MKPEAQRFLDRWSQAPKGTSAAAILRDLGLSRYFARNEAVRDPGFKRQYQTVQQYHRRNRRPHDRLSPVELHQRLERFLEELQTQADRQEPFNQAAAARAAGIPPATLWAKRNPRSPSYDPDFAEAWMTIIGEAVLIAEEHAIRLATASAAEIAQQGDDWRRLQMLVKFLQRAPGSIFRDRRQVQVGGRVSHEHRHQGLVEAVADLQRSRNRPGSVQRGMGSREEDLIAQYDSESDTRRMSA